MRFPFMNLSPAEERLVFRLVLGSVVLLIYGVWKLVMG